MEQSTKNERDKKYNLWARKGTVANIRGLFL